VEKKPEREMKPKGERPKKSFNFYWIYGIIIVLILSIQLFQYGGRMEKITPTEYKAIAERGHVQRILIVNEQVVKVYIKEDSLKVEPHKTKLKGGGLTGDHTAGPQYAFNQGSSNAQKDEIVNDANRLGIPYEYETQSNWGESVYYIVLFGAMILIWVLVMRRLGGGGGPAGRSSTSARAARRSSRVARPPMSTSTMWPAWPRRRRSCRRSWIS
jgi:hypothetical protein